MQRETNALTLLCHKTTSHIQRQLSRPSLPYGKLRTSIPSSPTHFTISGNSTEDSVNSDFVDALYFASPRGRTFPKDFATSGKSPEDPVSSNFAVALHVCQCLRALQPELPPSPPSTGACPSWCRWVLLLLMIDDGSGGCCWQLRRVAGPNCAVNPSFARELPPKKTWPVSSLPEKLARELPTR